MWCAIFWRDWLSFHAGVLRRSDGHPANGGRIAARKRGHAIDFARRGDRQSLYYAVKPSSGVQHHEKPAFCSHSCSCRASPGASRPKRLGGPKVAAYRVYLGTSKNIYQCELDLKDGTLSKLALAAEVPNPSFVAIHPNKKFLYSVSEVNKGSIVAFSIDPKTGSLTQLNSQSAGGSGPCHLVVDKTGKAVLAANYGSGSCTSIPIKADGSLGGPASVIQHKGMSILPNPEGSARPFVQSRQGQQVRLLLRSWPRQDLRLSLRPARREI